MSLPAIVDGHNDALLRVRRSGGSLLERAEDGHLDVPRAREAGLAAGFFAVFVPGEERADWHVSGPPATHRSSSSAVRTTGSSRASRSAMAAASSAAR